LAAQGEALRDPEAMLLVDDRQAEAGEADLLLDHRVGVPTTSAASPEATCSSIFVRPLPLRLPSARRP
jgi:hypothetical protein